MPGFSLEPTLTLELVLGLPLPVGEVANSGPMICVPLIGGTLRSVEEGILSDLVNAECVNGLDTSRADLNQKFTRLEIKSIWKNKDGSMIYLSYDAVLRITEETKLIFMGSPDSKTTEFGHIFAPMRFETGNASLKLLEENQYVGSGRFIVEKDQPLKVEYKISRLLDE